MRRTSAYVTFLSIMTLVAVLPVAAQDYTVGQPILLPPQFYVGDRVEMRVNVHVASNVTLTVPKELPSNRWIVFHSIRVYPHGGTQEVRIEFTPYHPGTLPFPTINLGHIALRDLSIYVQPVLSSQSANQTTDLRPVFRQLLIPNTRLIIGFVVGVLLVVPLLWIGFYRFGRTRVSLLIRKVRENMPYRRLMKSLRILGQNAGEMRAKDFYIELHLQLRTYLSRKIEADFTALTTAELASRLEPLELTDAERDALIGVFRYGDLVKFAGRSASVRQRKRHVEELITIIASSAKRVAHRPESTDQPDGPIGKPKRRFRAISLGIRRRGYVPTFHRESAPRRKESKQHVDS